MSYGNKRTPMTDEQRQSLALDYLKACDNGGITNSGDGVFDQFAEDAQFYFPKWGLARGKPEIKRLFDDVGAKIKHIRHDYTTLNWILSGSDVFACEGTSEGEHQDGRWKCGAPEWGAGRWCNVFEIRDGLIRRVFVYLDPDYAGRDRDPGRYPWLGPVGARSPSAGS
jgi:hypothetical protein